MHTKKTLHTVSTKFFVFQPVSEYDQHIYLDFHLCALKNSHILPKGQWYAPSAVINDALIMR